MNTLPSLQYHPTITDLKQAEERIRSHVRITPVLESSYLNKCLGCRILLKAENLQRTGSFKIRGAFNKVSIIKKLYPEKEVVAFSSGNHAQGVACAAKYFNIPATIVMPSNAPKNKISRTKSYGADVVLYNRNNQNRAEVAKEIIDNSNALLVPPYDDPDIIAGQGSIGLEMIDYVKKIGTTLDVVLGPSSGGGMMSGCSIAFKNYNPSISLYCIEPEYYDDLTQSLKAKKRIVIKTRKRSICDALLLETPGSLTFSILKKFNAEGLTVSDNDAIKAMRFAFQVFKIVLEPSGAIPLAAALKYKEKFKNKTVGLICTGGNVEPNLFKKALS